MFINAHVVFSIVVRNDRKINILNLINSEFKASEKTNIVSFDIKDFKLPMNISIDTVNKLLGIKEFDTSFMGLYS